MGREGPSAPTVLPWTRAIGLTGAALVALGVLGFVAPLMSDVLGVVWQSGLRSELERASDLQRWRGIEAGVGGRSVSASVSLQMHPATPQRIHPAGRELGSGEPVGRLEIPAIGLSAIVLNGVEPEHLAKGPGHYPSTPLPHEPGNVCIAGHRVTFGRPFRRLDELTPGDSVVLRADGLSYTYLVESMYVVPRDDSSPLAPTDANTLTLTTCHPPHGSSQRLIVRAVRTREDPVDAWLRGEEASSP
jgi:sortase A